MKALKTIMLVAMTSLLLASCSNNEKAKKETESTDLNSNNVTTSSKAVTTPVNPEVSQPEIIDGNEPMKAIYHKKLYAHHVIDTRYEGSIAELDYSLLDGYSFVGTLSSKFENYKKDGKWVMPDTDLTSNYFEEGDALLYNEEKDNFLVWSQKSNYWVTITEFPVQDDV